MAKIIYTLNQSLDGYVNHTAFAPNLKLFHHFRHHPRRPLHPRRPTS